MINRRQLLIASGGLAATALPISHGRAKMTAGPRRLGSWIDSYLEYTEIKPSPLILRKWSAIATIAAAMERKIWVRTMGSDLYPGLYTILVGPPGVGKGEALRPAEVLLREIPDLKVGPSDMSAASLIDALNESTRKIVRLNAAEPLVEFNSLVVVTRELGVLIPAWESTLINNLTDIYDGYTLDQKRRGRDLRIKIVHPQINLLGACTPSYLNEVMPAGAWDQGFISRTILVYSGEKPLRDPFAEDSNTAYLGRLHSDLLHDLKTISLEFGKMSFTTPAATAIREWIKSGCPPVPQHIRLQFYNARRAAHLLKLCMVASIARSGDLVITIENYSEALSWLVEAEAEMPEIFKSMIQGGDSVAMEELWNYAWVVYSKEKKPILEHRLVHFLRERVAAHSVMRVLEVMVRSKMFNLVPIDGSYIGYVPASKQDRFEGSQPH